MADRREDYAPVTDQEWAMGLRKPKVAGSSDKTTAEIGETIGGFKQGKKSTTPESQKGPKPTDPGPNASLGERAAYSRALREWNAK